ncbi:MAG: DUF2156 domain-containing protein [Promethearchaeota archaeon]
MTQFPKFPDLKELGIQDKTIFDEYFKRYPPMISEFTFTNLFMWRHYYNFKWAILNENIVIVASPEEKQYFFPPIGENRVKETVLECLSYSEKLGFDGVMKRVPENIAKLFSLPSNEDKVKVEFDRDNSDYVYLIKNLIVLQGSNYRSQRQNIKQFRSQHEFEYIPLTKETIPGCLELQEDWCDIRACYDDLSLAGEDKAIFEALLHFETLNFRGGVILVEEAIKAFTMGEILNEDSTVVIHIEKGRQERDYRGVYETINKQFLENEWTNFKYVNREQDLGIEGLRKAKMSYHPEFMIDKYTLTKV